MPPKNSLESEQTNSSLNQGPAADDYNIFEDEKSPWEGMSKNFDAKQKKAEENAAEESEAKEKIRANNISTLQSEDEKQQDSSKHGVETRDFEAKYGDIEINSGFQDKEEEDYSFTGALKSVGLLGGEKKRKKSDSEQKNDERARIAKKSEEKDKYHRIGSKIGRFKDGIKHAATEAQAEKSAGYSAGNKVVQDHLALKYYGEEAAKEVEDGTFTLSQENRQPSTVGIFTKSFSDRFNYSATKPAGYYEAVAKYDADESDTNDKKNKADSLLINQYWSMADGFGKDKKNKNEDEEKVKKLYTYSKLRKFDIAKRTKREIKKQKELEKSERIIPTLSIAGITNLARDKAGEKILTFFTARKAKSSSDKRGIRGGIDFEISEDADGEQKVEAKKIKAGLLIPPSDTITQQLDAVEKKWDSKIAMAGLAKGGADIFINLSAILEAFQGVMNIGSRILTTISNYVKVVAFFFPPLLAIVAAIKTVTGVMKVIDKIITGCKAVFDGLAMMLNSNPALFSLLQGEAGGSMGKAAKIGITEAFKGGKEDTKKGGSKTSFNKEAVLNEKNMMKATEKGTNSLTGAAIDKGFGKGSIKHAKEAFNKGGSGHNPNSGAKMDDMTYEVGEKEMADEAFQLAKVEAEAGRSKLAEKLNAGEMKKGFKEAAKGEAETIDSKKGKEVPPTQQRNKERSQGSWKIAKEKIGKIVGTAKKKI